MTCLTLFKDIRGIPQPLLATIQTYNILIGMLNITGNAILIWTLRRTHRTTSMSHQLVIIMSGSDIATGVIGLVSLTMLLHEQHKISCWLKVVTEFSLVTCNYLSTAMIFLIAFDRYLHMKYLERYAVIVTKRRYYSTIVIALLVSFSSGTLLTLQVPLTTHIILESFCITVTGILHASAMILYYIAMQTLRRKVHLIARNVINHSRALSTAGKRISICIIFSSTPILVLLILNNINENEKSWDALILHTCRWFAYITYLVNGFCSSVIFMSQNTPIRRFLERVARRNWNRIRSVVGALEGST